IGDLLGKMRDFVLHCGQVLLYPLRSVLCGVVHLGLRLFPIRNAHTVTGVPLQLDPFGRKCSFRISPTIRSGEERNAPIGPHIQVQKRRDRMTARLLISSLRPMIVGVMNWPSRNTTIMKSPAGRRPAPRLGAVTIPTSASTTIIRIGPTIGMKLRVAASAPKPNGKGNPVAAAIRPAATPTHRLMHATVKR